MYARGYETLTMEWRSTVKQLARQNQHKVLSNNRCNLHTIQNMRTLSNTYSV
jgi:hypothetical protein